MEIHELLDRFELLYPHNNNLADLRRAYVDKDQSSIFRLLGMEDTDLRSAVMDKNIHSIFRLVSSEHIDIEELRKAVVEKNLHSIFRVFETIDKSKLEDLRKAVIEDNLHALFRLVDNEDLRQATLEDNLHSLFRIVEDEDLRKLLLEDNVWKMWPLLERYTNTQFIKAFKDLFRNNVDFDKDCFSRGQIASKKWLIEELKKIDKNLGTVFLCAGWYATLVPMLEEADIKFDKIRSFDIDKEVWKIAEVFNKDLVLDDWKFKATTQDIHDINYNTNKYNTVKSNGETEQLKDSPDTIINTSCEHIGNFDSWYAKLPTGKLVILQSNNYFDISEHVNCVHDISQFEQMTPMQEVYFTGELKLEKYTRYMRIGRK
tara:strand:+ start:397 stop:1515 length:1119 start_codon:yes stop_codon:yes gene_type:complete